MNITEKKRIMSIQEIKKNYRGKMLKKYNIYTRYRHVTDLRAAKIIIKTNFWMKKTIKKKFNNTKKWRQIINEYYWCESKQNKKKKIN